MEDCYIYIYIYTLINFTLSSPKKKKNYILLVINYANYSAFILAISSVTGVNVFELYRCILIDY